MPQYSGIWTLSQASQAVKNQTWTDVPPSVVEYLIVGGGGGGGGASTSYNMGAGGGAGGLLSGYSGITANTSYFVTVGAAGSAGVANPAGPGGSGSNSVFDSISSGASTGRLTAYGGGFGALANGPGANQPGGNGGSGGGNGGGSSVSGSGGAGLGGQGNQGGSNLNAGAGAGGGGAGQIGLPNISTGLAGDGGAGIASDISGTRTTYAGGGGGGGNAPGSYFASGGAGGGGSGGARDGAGGAGAPNTGGGGGGAGGGGAGGPRNGAGGAGAPNTGGGGGGAGNQSATAQAGGAGGSGVAIIRYPGTTQFFTGGTLSYASGYISHTFYANGVLAPTTPTRYANPDYQIARSLRFNSADSPYVNKTWSANGSRTTATASLWVKRGSLGAEGRLIAFDGTGSGTIFWLFFNSSDQLQIYISGTATGLTTTQVFRDPSAWYHIVVGIDTNQPNNTDKIKLYVNGSQITAFTGTQTYYSQGANIQFNNTAYTGYFGYINSTAFSGYMADINWIDGQQLTPSSFGWTNPATGVWSPLDFVGTYGTNGFNLTFSDNSNVTSATLGADTSGNGNNWLPSNFSVTAGAGNDSLVDSPTSYGTDTGVGGEVRGNYCTLNPLAVDQASLPTITNGNLDISVSGALATIPMPTGTWYWEATCTSTDADQAVGAYSTSETGKTSISGGSNPTYGFIYQANGNARQNGTVVQTWSTFTNNDILSFTYDASIYQLKAYKNNSLVGTITLTTPPSGDSYVPMACCLGGSFTFNFGQRPFAYTAPSGFKALCTQNLPTPTIGATSATLAGKYFNTVLYTGNGATQTIGGVGFQPDFVWYKSRSSAVYNHGLFDSVRGVTKQLFSNSTAAEATYSGVTAFDSGGFTVGSDVGGNESAGTMVAWNWRASNATAVTNTSGSITSSVSASPTSGFSVVTYTNASSGTVGHGLGVAPAMVIYKDRTNVTNWIVLHQSLANMSSSFLVLNLTNAVATLGTALGGSPTSSVIYTNTDIIQNAAASVAYCFAPIAGYSAFGSYTGNGSADGPFVFLGFRPAFWILKRTDTTGEWFVFDSARDTYNAVGNYLKPYGSAAEASFASVDFLSNGFKIRQAGFSSNGGTFIYMAFASNPFKYSLAR